MKARFDRHNAAAALGWLFPAGAVVEVRIRYKALDWMTQEFVEARWSDMLEGK